MEWNIPRLKAQRLLDQARTGQISIGHEGWYELTLMATGDKEEAFRAAKEYVKSCNKAKITPE